MKKIILGLGLVLILLLSSCSITKTNKLKLCPEKWYQNRMPGSGGSEYFILNSERRELSEFDLNWVKENCNITPEVVV
jgi:hypothetical protein